MIRYPFHFHVMGDKIGKGYYVNESSFHHGYQRCLTVHGTSGIAVKNNVGFNVTGNYSIFVDQVDINLIFFLFYYNRSLLFLGGRI